MTFSEREFRNALGLFATGVAVVTTTAPDGARVGATISSFNSVSLSPPLVLLSVARSAKAFDVWSAADAYTVNLLKEGQEDLSNRFARSLGDKWAGLRPEERDGFLHLPGALAAFACESYARYDGGDHLILVGRVRAFEVTSDAEPRPLVFYKGGYRRLETDRVIDTPQDLDLLLHGW